MWEHIFFKYSRHNRTKQNSTVTVWRHMTQVPRVHVASVVAMRSHITRFASPYRIFVLTARDLTARIHSLREVGQVSAKRQRPPCRVATSPSQVSCVAGRVPRSPLRSRRVLERETQTRQLSKPIQDAAARKHARWQFSRLRRCAQMSAASATSVRQEATALLQQFQAPRHRWCSNRIRGAAAGSMHSRPVAY